MKKFFFIAMAFLGVGSHQVIGQTTETYNDVWFLWLSNYQINDNWSIGNELHWRNTNFLSDKEQLLIRPFVSYRSNESIGYSLGYSYIRSYPFTEKVIDVPRPEHNTWEQITLNHQLRKLSISHRYRLEQRFQGDVNGDIVIDDFSFSHRFRYRLTLKHSLGDHNYIHLFNEVWVKANQKFRGTNFDRNWVYVGIGRTVTDIVSVELAYLHQSIRVNESVYQRHPTFQLTLKTDLNSKN